MNNKQKAIQEIIKIALKQKTNNDNNLRKIKAAVIPKFGIKKMPADVEILKEYKSMIRANEGANCNSRLLELFKTRRVRTLSGVAVIAVLTKPYPCPGNCSYCPSQKDMPKSYLDNEPAVMRAMLNEFDPYRQVQARLRALHNNGHETDKCELIVMGGTWSYLPKRYQTWFIKRCFDAFNKQKTKNIDEAKKVNEKAKHRVVGMTLETRPDYINNAEAKRMRWLGATRVELGIQSVFDDVLSKNKRGHNIAQAKKGIAILREHGFKMTFHMMPNLPGSTLKKDFDMFKILFTDPGWQPDQIKIYPCVVTKDSEIYKWYKAGKYKAYTDKQLIDLLIKVKAIVPPYVRITRLIRDIPAVSIIAGNKITNLRQILHNQNVKCKCIRCREPKKLEEAAQKLKTAKLKIRKYKIPGGQELFLSIENTKYIYAFLRLNLSHHAMIREVHTYGQMTPVESKGKSVQHLGLGKKLIKKAEKIAKQTKYKKLSVISGVGVRDYYRKQGYKLEDEYMVKKI